MHWIEKYAIAIPAGLGYAVILYILLCFTGGVFVGIMAGLTNNENIDSFDSLAGFLVTIFLIVSLLSIIPVTWWISRFLTKETEKVNAIAPMSVKILQ
jgi:uncharacterized membrane protein AbrB (regulator of aidB expression)